MAQKGMRPEVKAAKLRNNKVGMLVCSTSGCENEFYVAMPTYPAVRKCAPCFVQGATGVQPAAKTFLQLIGLL